MHLLITGLDITELTHFHKIILCQSLKSLTKFFDFGVPFFHRYCHAKSRAFRFNLLFFHLSDFDKIKGFQNYSRLNFDKFIPLRNLKTYIILKFLCAFAFKI